MKSEVACVQVAAERGTRYAGRVETRLSWDSGDDNTGEVEKRVPTCAIAQLSTVDPT